MLIGLTCDVDTISDRTGISYNQYFSPAYYAEAVYRSGGIPVILAFSELAQILHIIQRLHAIVITGGNFDIPPSLYQTAERPGLRQTKPERSEFEFRLCQAALERGIPLLGICGGMQLLNVVRGGNVYQDLAEKRNALAHEQNFDKTKPAHSVNLKVKSRLFDIFSSECIEVNSTHHQAVQHPGHNIDIVGRAPDGVIEAIEVNDHPFAVGVQWHPEIMKNDKQLNIYRALLAAAKKYRLIK